MVHIAHSSTIISKIPHSPYHLQKIVIPHTLWYHLLYREEFQMEHVLYLYMKQLCCGKGS